MNRDDKLKELEAELEESRKREKLLLEEVGCLKKENLTLIRTSIEFSDVKRAFENKNYDLNHIQEELKDQNIQLIKKSVALSEVMRQLEDKNFDLRQLQITLEDLIMGRTIELREINRKLLDEIEERKEAQETLKKSESMYRTIFEKTGTAIMILENDTTISMYNAKLLELSGYLAEDIKTGMTWTQFVGDPEELRKMLQYHYQRTDPENDAPNEYEFKFLCKNGEIKNVIVNINVIPETGKRLASIINISSWRRAEEAQKRLEAQLIQAQKMESIGTLAGGIAHDFNNILAALMGYLEMGLNSVEKESKMARWLNESLKACQRAKELIIQILTFSRLNEQGQQPIKPYLILNEALKFLRASLPSTINFKTDIRKDTGYIMGNATQFHQVIMNLCTNSAHAMNDSGGVLDVILKKTSLDGEPAVRLNIDAGDYIMLKISDTGHGIPESLLSRIFDPFFTTKKQGEGTGMGLSVIHGIVTSFNGVILVESEDGNGASFIMYFPVVSSDATEKKVVGPPPKGNRELVLLVDDDPDLTNMMHEMIENMNYQVKSFSDSVKAVGVFAASPDAFDLVITDMTMPGITGIELARRILKLRPDVPVLLCTGNDENLNLDMIEQIGIKEHLAKPVERKVLGETMKRVLEKNNRSQGTQKSGSQKM